MSKNKDNFDQLALSLPLEASVSRADLIESDANSLAIELIDNWPKWPANVVVLAGPVGSGKTHMARVWADYANAVFMQSESLAGEVHKLDPSKNLVLEDMTSENLDENALFHCFNALKANGAYLMILSREFPSAWQLELADLKSRMRTAHIVELHEPDDELLSRILVKLFSDRQLHIEPTLIDYLVTRMERSLGVAGKIVEWLDQEALAKRVKINRSLAAKALAHFENAKQY